MSLSVGDVRSLARSFDDLTRYLCPLIAKLMFLLLFGMVFGLSNYTLLIVCSSHLSTPNTLFQMSLLVWVIFNIIFNYCMACFVPAGSPQDIPSSLLGEFTARCRKCGGVKPPRAHHCSICDQCVLQMDRSFVLTLDHCPWIGGCMGHHNRQYFNNFITYTTLGLLYCAYLIEYHRTSPPRQANPSCTSSS